MPHAVQIPGPVLQRAIALPLRGRAVRETRGASPGFWAAAARVLGMALLFLLAGCLCVAGAAAAYSLKRALNLDVVPGVDMLPDERIEAAIRAVLALLGF